MTSTIGVLTWVSYSFRCAWNHSRSLLRFKARRNRNVFSVNGACSGTALS